MDVGGLTFSQEHVGDFGGGVVAEELAKSFLVVSDAMSFDESEKISRRETGEGGFGEVRIGGDEVFRGGVNVGEIATAPAGDEDFLANAVGVFEYGDAATAFTRFDGAKKSCGASAENQNVEGTGQRCLTEIGSSAIRYGGQCRAEIGGGEGEDAQDQ